MCPLLYGSQRHGGTSGNAGSIQGGVNTGERLEGGRLGGEKWRRIARDVERDGEGKREKK